MEGQEQKDVYVKVSYDLVFEQSGKAFFNFKKEISDDINSAIEKVYELFNNYNSEYIEFIKSRGYKINKFIEYRDNKLVIRLSIIDNEGNYAPPNDIWNFYEENNIPRKELGGLTIKEYNKKFENCEIIINKH